MNNNLRGRPFSYPEGFILALLKFVPDLKKPDHATIHRRVNKLDLGLDKSLVDSVDPSLWQLRQMRSRGFTGNR